MMGKWIPKIRIDLRLKIKAFGKINPEGIKYQ